MPRLLLLALGLLVASADCAWPFGGGGKPGDAPAQSGSTADAFAGLADVSAEELQQAQAMMRDPGFMQQMLSQLKDPAFISHLKDSLASPEARATMQKMGMKVPSDEEVEEAIKKLESPEFQEQLKARAEALQQASAYAGQGAAAGGAGGSKFTGSRLGASKVEMSGQQAEAPALGGK